MNYKTMLCIISLSATSSLYSGANPGPRNLELRSFFGEYVNQLALYLCNYQSALCQKLDNAVDDTIADFSEVLESIGSYADEQNLTTDQARQNLLDAITAENTMPFELFVAMRLLFHITANPAITHDEKTFLNTQLNTIV